MAPRRILFLDTESRLLGAERSLADLVTRLDRARWRPEVLLTQPGQLAGALAERGIPVHTLPLPRDLLRLPRRLSGDAALRALAAVKAPGAVVRLARFLRRGRWDLLHTNNLKAHVLGGAAARLAGVPQVMHLRDILLPGPMRGIVRAIARRWARATAVISEAVGRSMFPDLAGVRVIHNGVDPALLAGERPRAAGEPPRVGIVGQIARWKGQEVFLRAARRVLERRPDARFSVIGKVAFAENEAAYGERLAALAAEPRLAGRVAFSGHVEEIGPHLRALDVLVHASIEPEPFGRVIVEAMCAGTPVVASDCGAPREIVAHERTGLLVPPGDEAAMAAAVLRLLDDPALAARLAAAARAEACERFHIARTVGQVEALYEELLGQ